MQLVGVGLGAAKLCLGTTGLGEIESASWSSGTGAKSILAIALKSNDRIQSGSGRVRLFSDMSSAASGTASGDSETGGKDAVLIMKSPMPEGSGAEPQ